MADKDSEARLPANSAPECVRRPKVTVGEVRSLPPGVRLEDTVTCERCGGVGEVCVRETWEDAGAWIECGTCGGTGRVLKQAEHQTREERP